MAFLFLKDLRPFPSNIHLVCDFTSPSFLLPPFPCNVIVGQDAGHALIDLEPCPR